MRSQWYKIAVLVLAFSLMTASMAITCEESIISDVEQTNQGILISVIGTEAEPECPFISVGGYSIGIRCP